jgi:hypothetical protein
MDVVKSLRVKGMALAGQAMEKVFADQRRAEQIGELLGMLQKSRKRLDDAQEAAMKGLGLASSGDLKAASKRLAGLRKSARQLDEKLGTLISKVP